MDLLAKMNKNEVRELFSKNWMTHDAIWYGSCLQEVGPEKANRLNKTAVRLMAGVEIQRMLKLMGLPKKHVVHTFAELAEIVGSTFELVRTDFMSFEFGFPEKNLLQGRFDDCFAYNGVRKFGIVDTYDCGILERIKGWLDGLQVSYQATAFSGCLMHQHGKCEVDFHFELD